MGQQKCISLCGRQGYGVAAVAAGAGRGSDKRNYAQGISVGVGVAATLVLATIAAVVEAAVATTALIWFLTRMNEAMALEIRLIAKILLANGAGQTSVVGG